MHFTSRLLTTTKMLKLVMFNVFGGLFLWWLVIDEPRRKAALFVLIPCMLLIDVVSVRRMVGQRNGASISLPIIYICGVAYGVWWLVQDFEWWKMFLLVIPFLLLIINIGNLIRSGGRLKADQ